MINGKSIDDYAKFASDEILQQALKEILPERIADGELMYDYAKFATEETTNEFKNNESFQQDLKEILPERIANGWYIDNYAKFASSETLQQALKEGLPKIMANGWSIDGYAKFASDEILQQALKEGLPKRMADGELMYDYTKFATKETTNEFKNNESFQQDLKEILPERIANGWSIDGYAKFATEKTIIELKNNESFQQDLKEILPERIADGWSIDGYAKFTSDEIISHLFEKQELRIIAEKAIEAFFDNSQGLQSEIQEVLSTKSNEEIEKALFDKTMLPVGIKIHTNNESNLSDMLAKTKLFIAHGYNTTFVANPVANTTVLEMCLEVLEKKRVKENMLMEKESYFQTCCPERLENKECGIATIAFLLGRKNTLQYTEDLIKHNQNTNGITIYDAGNVVIGNHFVPQKGEQTENPRFNGRTDILLCSNIEDIKTANLILTLLIHATYQEKELKHKELGQSFIQEFKDILQKHKHKEWLDNKFVDIKDYDNISGLSNVLMSITKHRNEINEQTRKYNAGVNYLQTNEKWEESILDDLKKMKEELDSSMLYKIKSLLNKYQSLLYPNGEYVDERKIVNTKVKLNKAITV